MTTPVQTAIENALSALRAAFRPRFEAAGAGQALRDVKAKILGKKGELTAILKQMGQAPPDARRAIGELANAVKDEVEAAFDARLAALAAERRDADLNGAPFDLTLPGRKLARVGHAHPISIARDEIVEVLESLGFAVHDGPEIELEENNFTKLGFPPDHPATDMQDTFWTTQGTVLRTHTSNIQVRAMTGHKPPFGFIAPGVLYRRDDDATHSPMFHPT